MFVILTQLFKTVKETPQRNHQHREYKKCSKKDGHRNQSYFHNTTSAKAHIIKRNTYAGVIAQWG
jgi:hypothetical protein